ncbi:hypothetical protein B484DRAFT_399676 [Ochromonadaceae sp. CCMP2298]|nr:hypothetical protein B484DRAFT_399676 [Ochromonadaceae sp. CCMP2298]
MMSPEEDETGGTLARDCDIIAQYQTTRVRSFWASYKRIFQLTKSAVLTLDPGQFRVTNTFPYSAIVKLDTDEKHEDQFSLEVNKTVFLFKTAHRAQLLCQLFECIAKCVPEKFKTAGPIRAQRLRKNGARVDCQLAVAPYGLIEIDSANQVLQEYKWVNVSRVGSDENKMGFFFEATGRIKIFFVEDVEKIVTASKFQLTQVGVKVPFLCNQDVQSMVSLRANAYAAIPAAVSVFDVNKSTRRTARPVPRQLHVSEEHLLEKDASGFQFVSFQRIDSIYALVRSWDNPREFSVEFNDGSARTYTSAVRDSLLALLMDVCHAAGNVRVIVTGQVSDGLRLMPRFAEEQYEASLKDAFFGASSIEAWFLARLAKACKSAPLNTEEVEQACRELNANVPCPGITPSSDLILTLYRIIPSVHGYKCFVEVREVDTRQLLKFEHDFVNYWTLEVLMVLCRCPLSPRNVQQEFINKHTLLTDKMLLCLISLMSYRADDSGAGGGGGGVLEEEEGYAPEANREGDLGEGDGEEQGEDAPKRPEWDMPPVPRASKTPSSAPAHTAPAKEGTTTTEEVLSNPSTFAHLPSHTRTELEPSEVEPPPSDLVNFTPNSLVVIGAAALLESLVCSRRDSSSPELMHQVLEIMGDRCEVLVSMLRSTSFLIMENAAILMFTLVKNRPQVAPLLKELALSECLVLRHFYNAVFSPSATQRFISRFLVATWITGTNPGKALLLRMIPSGLAEYLKYASITEEHRRNLDNLEDEFYNTFANAQGNGMGSMGGNGGGCDDMGGVRGVGAGAGSESGSGSSSNTMQARMRKRISEALKEQLADKPRY